MSITDGGGGYPVGKVAGDVIHFDINTVKNPKGYRRDTLKLFSKFLQSKGIYRQASWRHVKIDAGARKDTVTLVHVRFRRPPGFGDRSNWYDQKLVFGTRATLEDVLRKFIVIANRGAVEHGRCVRD